MPYVLVQIFSLISNVYRSFEFVPPRHSAHRQFFFPRFYNHLVARTQPLIGRIGDGWWWLCFIYSSVAFELWQNIACRMISSICEKRNLFDLYAADASESFDFGVYVNRQYVRSYLPLACSQKIYTIPAHNQVSRGHKVQPMLHLLHSAWAAMHTMLDHTLLVILYLPFRDWYSAGHAQCAARVGRYMVYSIRETCNSRGNRNRKKKFNIDMGALRSGYNTSSLRSVWSGF